MAVKLNTVAILSLLLLSISAAKAQSGVFDVTKYGGKADETTDLSQSLLSAWKDACDSTTASKVVIPKGTYLLKPVTLAGPCKAPIEVQLQGTVKAPTDVSIFKGANWVVFNRIDRFTLSGGGVFDGQGAAVWGKSCDKTKFCGELPINVRFNFVSNATVRSITSLNSKQFHVNVLGCQNLSFLNVNVTAPEGSPNTDGIHIGRSSRINITDTTIGTGDDCISIGDGTQDLTISKVTCGPGHGFSIGSLGKYDGEAPVVGVSIVNCTLNGATNGVRIKTWPASKDGSVSGMHFQDLIMKNVSNPINIDQRYCPWNKCNLQSPSRVKISDVRIQNIKGDSATQVAVKLDCSSAFPCQNVVIGDIDIKYSGREGPATSQCANVKPTLSGTQNPPACGSAVSPPAA